MNNQRPGEPTRGELMESAFWAPCENKDHLRRWIKTYLGIDLPDGHICDDEIHAEPSNSSPLELIWEIYDRAMYHHDWDKSRFLAYSAREGYKTLACSIMEVLSMFHWERSVAHGAAIEAQAAKCAQYVEGHLSWPILNKYVIGNNKRTIEVGWYESHDKTQRIPFREYKELVRNGEIDEFEYTRKTFYLKILVATITGMNSEHVPFLVLDELDIMPERPFKEAQAIPSKTSDGNPPIVFMTSTRKFSNSIVQREIDGAKDSGLQIRHWSIIDVGKPCPPERHHPEKPKIPIYYSVDTLKTMSKADFDLMTAEQQALYHMAEGYDGCLNNCPLFAGCRGRLASRPIKSKSKLLKDVEEITTVFKTYAGDPGFVKAQYLTWKAENVGAIFPFLNPAQHKLTAAQMAEMMTGQNQDPNMSKAQLIQTMHNLGVRFVAGMDHGYVHNFAVVLAAIWGDIVFVFHVISVSNFELSQKIDLCRRELTQFKPDIYPDIAYPGDNTTFKNAGFRIRDQWTKDTPLSISCVRSKIMPAPGAPPEIYFLAGDAGCDFAFDMCVGYRWKLDAAGKPTDQPHKEMDDEVDALRYMMLNEFKHKIFKKRNNVANVNINAQTQQPVATQVAQINKQLMANEIISRMTDNGGDNTGTLRVKKGKFFVSI